MLRRIRSWIGTILDPQKNVVLDGEIKGALRASRAEIAALDRYVQASQRRKESTLRPAEVLALGDDQLTVTTQAEFDALDKQEQDEADARLNDGILAELDRLR